MKKYDAERVNYRKAETSDTCDRCKYYTGFKARVKFCAKFSGRVAWNKTCDLWERINR